MRLRHSPCDEVNQFAMTRGFAVRMREFSVHRIPGEVFYQLETVREIPGVNKFQNT